MTITLVDPPSQEKRRHRTSTGQSYYGRELDRIINAKPLTRTEQFLIRHGGVVWGLICVAICAAVGIAVAVTL